MSNVNQATTVIPFSSEIETHYLCAVRSSSIHLFIHLFTHSTTLSSYYCKPLSSSPSVFPKKKSPYNRFLESDVVSQLQMNSIACHPRIK